MRQLIAVLLLASVTISRADQAILNAQQALKDQGFYYGQVTGEKNADTSAAIRRYQIRSGLEITGELNEETLQALRKAPASPAPVVAAATPPPAAAQPREQPQQQTQDQDTSDLRNDNVGDNGPADVFPRQPAPPASFSNSQPETVYQGRSGAPVEGFLAGTPFETAPPPVQQKVLVDAQRILARRGLFQHEVDGVFSADMEFSLRAYQSHVGLRPTGRLDLETLAALELLPGAHERVYSPRRSLQPGAQAPVRGEWIRP